jgi:hypothetical protein
MRRPVFATVTVSFSDGVAAVDRPSLTLYYDHPGGPHSVRWRVASRPEGTARIKVLWEREVPFGHVRRRRGEVHGTANRGRRGSFRYAVLFVDARGQVLAGVDPVIRNEPRPRLAGGPPSPTGSPVAGGRRGGGRRRRGQ